LRDADWLRCSRVRRGNVRHQAQENLRAHADTYAAQTPEEKNDGGEVTDAETERDAEKKDRREPDSVGDAISECVCFSEEEKILAESHPGIFSECFRFGEKEKVFAEPHSAVFTERVEQEEETKEFSHADSVPNRVAGAFGDSERNSRSGRDPETDGIRVPIAEKERSAGNNLGEPDLGLRKVS
jgi:hypothetical protein